MNAFYSLGDCGRYPAREMLTVIGDIHGNVEALDAVLTAAASDEVLCLGDVVGYGPDSIACVRRSIEWKLVIAGAMDRAILSQTQDTPLPALQRHIDSLRERIMRSPDAESLLQILDSYIEERVIDGIRYFHGCPGNVNGWIFPEDSYATSKLDKLVDYPENVFIGGGSHLSGLYRRLSDCWEFVEAENEKRYDLPTNGKTLATIGSVGQPRDGDPRAAYATVDKRSIVFYRVDYDIETTQSKIIADPDIDDIQGWRLPEGR